VGYVVYSAQVGAGVFVFTNGVILLTTVIGQLV